MSKEEKYLNECFLAFLERKIIIQVYKNSYKKNHSIETLSFIKVYLLIQNTQLSIIKSNDK